MTRASSSTTRSARSGRTRFARTRVTMLGCAGEPPSRYRRTPPRAGPRAQRHARSLACAPPPSRMRFGAIALSSAVWGVRAASDTAASDACRERHTVAQVRRGERPFIRALPDVQPELRPYCAVRPNNLPPATRTPTRTPLEGTHGCTHARTQAICSRTWMRDSRFRCKGGSGLRYGGPVTSRTGWFRRDSDAPLWWRPDADDTRFAGDGTRAHELPQVSASCWCRDHSTSSSRTIGRCALCCLSSEQPQRQRQPMRRCANGCGGLYDPTALAEAAGVVDQVPAWWIRCMRRTCSRTSHSRSSISASSLGTGAARRRAAVTAWKVH